MMFDSGRKCKACKQGIEVHLDNFIKLNRPRDVAGYYHVRCIGGDPELFVANAYKVRAMRKKERVSKKVKTDQQMSLPTES